MWEEEHLYSAFQKSHTLLLSFEMIRNCKKCGNMCPMNLRWDSCGKQKLEHGKCSGKPLENATLKIQIGKQLIQQISEKINSVLQNTYINIFMPQIRMISIN